MFCPEQRTRGRGRGQAPVAGECVRLPEATRMTSGKSLPQWRNVARVLCRDRQLRKRISGSMEHSRQGTLPTGRVAEERVRLRPWDSASDGGHWQDWLRDPEIARWIGPHPERTSMSALHDFCIERVSDGLALGRLMLTDPSEDGRAELVVAIGRAEERGRRYGREAIERAVAFAYEQLGVSEVYLRVVPENRRAVRCYLASGFVKEGVLRRSPTESILLMSHRSRAV